MKKTIVFVLLTLLTSTVFADNAGNSDETLAVFTPKPHTKATQVGSYIDTQNYYSPNLFDVYAGIAGGTTYFVMTRKGAITGKPSAYDFQGGGYAGFGKRMATDFYLGGEIYAMIGKVTTKNNFGKQYLRISLKNMYGADMILGCYAGPAKFYIRAGGTTSEFGISTNAEPTFQTDSFSNTAIGLHVGIGADLFLQRFLSLRPELDYSTFQTIYRQYGADKNKFSPQAVSFNLGITIHFTNNIPPQI